MEWVHGSFCRGMQSGSDVDSVENLERLAERNRTRLDRSRMEIFGSTKEEYCNHISSAHVKPSNSTD